MLVLDVLWLGVLAVLSITGQRSDEALEFRIPAHAVLTSVVPAALVIIVCTWRLLMLLQRDCSFSEASTRWVDVIVWALAVGWAVVAGGAAVLVGVIYFTPELRDPGPLVALREGRAPGLPALLMLVRRGPLRQPVENCAELAEVT